MGKYEPGIYCNVCGKPITPERIATDCRQCTDACAREANEVYHPQARIGAAPAILPPDGGGRRWRTFTCQICGELFRCRIVKLLCAKCTNTTAQLIHRGYSEVVHRPSYHPVAPARIFMRDNYVCRICGVPIGVNLSSTDPMSGSIDHIIPLSKGGWHAPDNLQAAHLICNSRKWAH